VRGGGKEKKGRSSEGLHQAREGEKKGRREGETFSGIAFDDVERQTGEGRTLPGLRAGITSGGEKSEKKKKGNYSCINYKYINARGGGKKRGGKGQMT